MMWTERRRDKERVLQRREAIQKKEGKYDLLTLRPLALPLHPSNPSPMPFRYFLKIILWPFNVNLSFDFLGYLK